MIECTRCSSKNISPVKAELDSDNGPGHPACYECLNCGYMEAADPSQEEANRGCEKFHNRGL